MRDESQAFAWLACGGAILLLVSPLKLLWARAPLGWTVPFVIWLGLIALGGWLSRGRGPGSDR